MNLHNIDKIPNLNVLQTYRSRTWPGVLIALVVMLLLTAFVAIPKQNTPAPIAYTFVPGLLAFFTLVILIQQIKLYRREENWLLKLCEEGLLINLRSFRSHNYPPETHEVVFIPKASILTIGKSLENRQLPHKWHREKSQYAYLDLYLDESIDLSPLQEYLHKERRRIYTHDIKTNYLIDCPVRVPESNVIRLVWDFIHPNEDKALDDLEEKYALAPERRLMTSAWEELSGDEKESLIDQLWEWGHTDRAYILASQHYTTRENKARQMVDDRCIDAVFEKS